MKLFYNLIFSSFLICVFSNVSHAVIVEVNVEDFEFGPGDFTINVGDTVRWSWDNSATGHTTTSTTIPSGAATWNQPINASSQIFMYIPTVAGSYNYECTIHPGMNGHFNVLGSSDVPAIDPATTLFLSGIDPMTNEVQFKYSIPKTSQLSIRMFDFNGNEVGSMEKFEQNAGEYSQNFFLPDHHAGIYIVTLETETGILVKKLFLE